MGKLCASNNRNTLPICLHEVFDLVITLSLCIYAVEPKSWSYEITLVMHSYSWLALYRWLMGFDCGI